MALNNNSYKISGNSKNAKISFCAEPCQACNATSAESAARKLYKKLCWPKMKLVGARDCTKTKFHEILEQGLTFLFCKIRLGRGKYFALHKLEPDQHEPWNHPPQEICMWEEVWIFSVGNWCRDIFSSRGIPVTVTVSHRLTLEWVEELFETLVEL